MLSPVQEIHSLSSRDLPENQSAKHRYRIRRGAVKMPGGLSRGVEAGHRPLLAQDFRLCVGRKAAEGIGDRADQRIGEEGRRGDGARPVRFRRLQFARRREAIAARGIEARGITRRRRIEGIDRLPQIGSRNSCSAAETAAASPAAPCPTTTSFFGFCVIGGKSRPT
jgi:hypothetical protein